MMDSATLSRHRIVRTITLLILTSFILGLFAFTLQSTAAQTTPTASDKAYGWLQAQQLPNGLVDSFEHGGAADDLCVVYDQAVAAIAFVVKADYDRARAVLTALRGSQWDDGSWHNIYACSNPNQVMEWHRDVGPAVWVALAVASYEAATGDLVTYREMALRAVNFGFGFQQDDGGVNGGFEATQQGYRFHSWGSTEHAIDLYAAARYFYGDQPRTGQVKQFLETVVWDSVDGRWLGGRADLRDPLDVNTWGVAALGDEYIMALEYALATHRVTLGGIDAVDFNSDRNDIWFEGTGQLIVALQAVGRTSDAQYFLQQMAKGQKANGGIPYSLQGTNNGYWTMSTANAVSSAAWLIFADAAFNPLGVGTATITSVAPTPDPVVVEPPVSASDKAYGWLRSQQLANGLVDSFEHGGAADDLCVVYDQAVAAIAFVVKADYDRARAVLTALRGSQWGDGSWHNIYACSNPNQVMEWHRDVGPAVWVALAVASYEAATGDLVTYREMALRAVNFGFGFQQDDGGVNGGFEATQQGYRFHSWGSTEHAIDLYAAARYFYGDQPRTGQVKQFLETVVWEAAKGRWLGGRADQRDPLDVNTWGVAALGDEYIMALEYALGTHRVTLGGIDAMDFNSDRNDIWFEGTGQLIVALHAVGRTSDAQYFLQQMAKGQTANGGIPYSLQGTNNGYWTMSTANAVSSAAWLIFADAAFNPLGLGTATITSVAPTPDPVVVEPPVSASDKAYGWLRSQQLPNGLVDSFEQGGAADDLCVVYDQAVAAIAFVVKADYDRARAVLTALRGSQWGDGSWHNIYACSNPNQVMEWHRDVGPAVWVALAVASYEDATGDLVTYREMALRAVNFGFGFQQDDGGVNGGFEATQQGYRFHSWGSTEHAIDLYAAARYFYGDQPRIGQVKQFLETVVWEAAKGRWLGGRADQRDPLDVNTWGVAALGDEYIMALEYALGTHRVTLGGIDAVDFNSDRNDIWFEGTGQLIVALHAVGRTSDAAYFLHQMAKGQTANGGIPYSLQGTNNGYWTMSTANAVSSAAWLIFADAAFNPLGLIGDDQAPTAPTNLTASLITATTAQLAWNAANDNIGVEGYAVYLNNAATPATECRAVRTTQCTLTSLNPLTTYSITVKAFDAAGNVSLASNSINITTPDVDRIAPTAPTNLNATNVTAASILLSWTASSDNVGVVGYNAYLGTNPIAVTSCNGVITTVCNLTGLAPDTQYSITVKAFDAAGNASLASNSILVTTLIDTQAPTPPLNLQVLAKTTTTVDINWTASSDNVGVIGYNAYLGTNPIAVTSCNAVTATMCSLTGLTPNTQYSITVKAFDAVGNVSAASDGLVVRTNPLPTFGNPWYLLDGATHITPSQLSTTSGNAAASDSIPAASATNIDGQATQTISYEAENLTASYDSSKTTEFELFIDAGTAVGNGTQARIAYDFTGDGTWDRIETYNYFATDPVNSWERYTHTRGLRSATGSFANLTNGKVKLELWNAIGNNPSLIRTNASSADGQQSTLVLPFLVTTVDNEAPTAPTNLLRGVTTANSAAFTWQAASDNVGVVGYSAYLNGSQVAVANCQMVTGLGCNLTGLSANTSYSVVVTAFDAAGNQSEASASITFTTSDLDSIQPTAPTNVAIANIGATTATVSWNAATDNLGVVGYSVYLNGADQAASGCSMVDALNCTLSGLNADTSYTLVVTAFDAAGNQSEPSATVTFTTQANPFRSQLYLLDGASQTADGILSVIPGNAADSDPLASAQNGNWDGLPTNAITYQINDLTATYDPAKTTQFNLYLDAGIGVGNASQVRVSYDFTGDGTWDRIETYNYFATDPVVGWELYNHTRGLRSATGSFANLTNGRLKVELWNAIGNGGSLVRTSATTADGQQSTLTLPFSE
ncbi:Fibronectin type III domain protein [Herpetosiphon aurantiacus DSM 785]|uniref:Fibronectin type III domain protein n=2 Tax=Herpetosiphon TaxID=64 RepID=A9AZG0_HERA2|nr:Fibronectin type III domain protein [Herpetosiphon aurantiacus DSM 785]